MSGQKDGGQGNNGRRISFFFFLDKSTETPRASRVLYTAEGLATENFPELVAGNSGTGLPGYGFSSLFRAGLAEPEPDDRVGKFFWRVDSAGMTIIQKLTHNLKVRVPPAVSHNPGSGVNIMKFWCHKWTLILQSFLRVLRCYTSEDESLTR